VSKFNIILEEMDEDAKRQKEASAKSEKKSFGG
jgi:hypothetical protein